MVVVVVRMMRTNVVDVCIVNGLINDHFFVMCGCLYHFIRKMARKGKKLLIVKMESIHNEMYQLTTVVKRKFDFTFIHSESNLDEPVTL